MGIVSDIGAVKHIRVTAIGPPVTVFIGPK